MRAASAWFLAGVFVIFSSAVVSCGSDEGSSDSSGGSGNVIGGAGSGSGGAADGGDDGRSGSSGSGGTAGAPAGPSRLGRGCVSDVDCRDSSLPDDLQLTCITAQDTVLDGGSPPSGLCTAPCTDEFTCAQYSENSYCHAFGPNNTDRYCVEACSFGDDPLGGEKCHNRGEFSCFPEQVINSNVPCVGDDECTATEVCFNGTCQEFLPACLPACTGDIDCPAGLYCDNALFRGVCVPEKPSKLPFGATCSYNPDENEEDPCNGACSGTQDSNGVVTGTCTEFCAFGNLCGWDGDVANGFCVYPSAFVPLDSIGLLDAGVCAKTCSCASECGLEEMSCFDFTSVLDGAPVYGNGVCSTGEFTPDEVLDDCPDNGSGGAGGSPN